MADNNSQAGRSPYNGSAMDFSATQRAGTREGSLPLQNSPHNAIPFESQVQEATPQQQFPGGQMFNVPGQSHTGPQLDRTQSPSAFNMSGMVGALPGFPNADQQRYFSAAHTNTLPYGQAPLNTTNYQMQPNQYYSQMQSSPQAHSGGPSPIHQPFPDGAYISPQQQYTYYSGHYGQSGQSQYYQPYGRGGQQGEAGMRAMHSGFSPGGPTPYPLYGSSGNYLRPGAPPAVSRGSSGSSSGSIPSTPRGPPRKPKQSGYALWVGNLPSGTVVSDLKDHFSRDATKEIESVFLISKSNCAFVNYRTEAACAAAMSRFHDSRFQGVRLVCRLRRSSTATSSLGTPSGPAALMPSMAQAQTAFDAISLNREASQKPSEAAAAEADRTGEATSKVHDKYFIMKSLTVEDMELSRRNNIWATQAHNEEALNKAYNTAEHVYLVFSANKSGEYFGFARMASPITEEAAASLDWAPRSEAVTHDPDIPRSIPTSATEFAPRGRIIDDSARGTIFWEADPEDEDLAPIISHEVDASVEVIKGEEKAETLEEELLSEDAQAFGKPFKIEWLSTNRLPFYRTRGLRNPWNANREVKIARDGTELETSVGRRLVQMFQKASMPEGLAPPLGRPPGPRPY